MKIYKYPLRVVDEQVINIPNINYLLDVQVQKSEGGQPVLWAAIDKDYHHNNAVKIYIVGTGVEFENDFINTSGKRYLCTFQLEGFVGHVFYEFLNV